MHFKAVDLAFGYSTTSSIAYDGNIAVLTQFGNLMPTSNKAYATGSMKNASWPKI